MYYAPYEETIKARFLTAFSILLDGKDALLKNCKQVQARYTDYSAIDVELGELLREIDVVTELTRKRVEENTATPKTRMNTLPAIMATWSGAMQ